MKTFVIIIVALIGLNVYAQDSVKVVSKNTVNVTNDSGVDYNQVTKTEVSKQKDFLHKKHIKKLKYRQYELYRYRDTKSAKYWMMQGANGPITYAQAHFG